MDTYADDSPWRHGKKKSQIRSTKSQTVSKQEIQRLETPDSQVFDFGIWLLDFVLRIHVATTAATCTAPPSCGPIPVDRPSRASDSWRNVLGVLGHEGLARSARVEVIGLVAEGLAIDGAPHQPAVGVDVHLADAQLGRRKILVLRHAAGILHLAARCVDPVYPFLRHARRTVHDHREALGQDLLDLGQAIKCGRAGREL